MTEKTIRTAPASASVMDSNSKFLNYSTRAVVVLVAIGAAVLSFDALTELARASGIRDEFSWIWAVVVDGFILIATFAAFALQDREGKAKFYAWITLGVFVIISILGNAWHAAIASEGYIMPMEAAVTVTAIPPLALFLAIHLLVIMVSPTSDQKAEMLRHRKKQERIRAIEDKELERLEKALIIKEVKATVSAVTQPVVADTAITVEPRIASTATRTSPEAAEVLEVSLVASQDDLLTEDQAIKRLRGLSHVGESLPTGKIVSQWIGKSERSGQNLLKRFKALSPLEE
jgi:hypothetical protein